MLIIRTSADMDRVLATTISAALRRLLTTRRDQLLFDTGGAYDLGELAHFIVVTSGDALPDIEAAVNYPITPDPPWEWVLDHDGLFEAPVIVSDDGFGIVLIVPSAHGVDAKLLQLLRGDTKA